MHGGFISYEYDDGLQTRPSYVAESLTTEGSILLPRSLKRGKRDLIHLHTFLEALKKQ